MIQFILNKPRNPKNIGAAARGMANFGFRRLSVVAPYSKAWKETRSAVHASDVVKKAKKYSDLKKALRTSHVVIGTSAGSRRGRTGIFYDLDTIKPIIEKALGEKKNVTILFGSEKSGLSNEDLTFCHYVVRIPTVEECPSMNLSQAVAVVAYSLRKPSTVPTPMAPAKTIKVESFERLITQALAAFTGAGLLKGWDPDRSEQRLRKAFYQWNLNNVDVAMLHSLFRWVLKRNSGFSPT